MPRCARASCGRWSPRFLRRDAGIMLDGRWFCSIGCVEGLARRRLLDARPPAAGLPPTGQIRLGVWLRHQAGLTESQVQQVLEAQRHTQLRFGAQVVRLGLVSAEEVLRALARQAGVGYLAQLDPSNVLHAPAGLSPHAARALSLVPFCEPEQGRVKVACAAPLPRMGLAAFRRLTGLAPEPYFVTDDAWETLVTAYGASVEDQTSSRFIETTDVSEAAATIAAAAAGGSGENARLTEARFEPYTWVRVENDGITHDVLLASGGVGLCPAVSTSH
jgi:hypothetical protein